MIEVQLTTRSMLKTIAAFDGRVLELFTDEMTGGSRRIHVGHMRSIGLAPAARGKEPYSLTVQCEYQIVAADVSAEALPAAQQLVAAVQQAMAGRAAVTAAGTA